MKRVAALAVILLALAAWPAAHAAETGLPATLRSNAVIDGDVIRLGDLWENLGDKADTAIVGAPQPGRHISLDGRWLAVVAAANGIDWHPATNFDRVVVERAGQTVDPTLIEQELREALDAEGLPAGTSFEVTNRAALAVVIPTNAQASVAVHDIIIDQRTQRFAAMLEVPAGSPSATRIRVQGRIFTMTRLPVLTHTMSRGDVITEHDVEWKDVREEAVRREIAIEPRELIGQEPRFQVKAGVPVRTTELQRPVMVTRNSTVTMVLRTETMTLSTMGRAIDDGGRGDIVKVTNLQTKQIVEARVDGPGTVIVQLSAPRTLSN